MKHQSPISICFIALILLLAACSKEDSSPNPAPGPGNPPPKTTELTVVVNQWQSYGGNTYFSIHTNLISSLNTSKGKIAVYAEVDGGYKKINLQPIEYAGGLLSASVSKTDLNITFHGFQVCPPPQNVIIKVVVED